MLQQIVDRDAVRGGVRPASNPIIKKSFANKGRLVRKIDNAAPPAGSPHKVRADLTTVATEDVDVIGVLGDYHGDADQLGFEFYQRGLLWVEAGATPAAADIGEPLGVAAGTGDNAGKAIVGANSNVIPGTRIVNVDIAGKRFLVEFNLPQRVP